MDPSLFLESLQKDLFLLYDKICNMEKSLWAQHACVCNFLYKDLNTRCFQMIVKVCRAKCIVHKLKDENKEWVSGFINLSNMVF